MMIQKKLKSENGYNLLFVNGELPKVEIKGIIIKGKLYKDFEIGTCTSYFTSNAYVPILIKEEHTKSRFLNNFRLCLNNLN